MMRNGRYRAGPALLMACTFASSVLLAGCDDLLEVSDPQRYTDDDLDQALEAVANGVEGDLYIAMDQYVIYTALNSDEYQHTGTWVDYDDLDHGRIIYGSAFSDGPMNEILRARAFALDAQDRFRRVMEDTAETSSLMAQVKVVEGWANLLLAQSWCEAPSEPDGPAVPDSEMYAIAIDKLTDAMATANSAGRDDYSNWALAGRARAHMMLGNYAEALADARAVPADFSKMVSFSANSGRQDNDIVQLTTFGNNTAAGMREFWWPQVDTDASMLIDPYTGESDPRVPIRFAPGDLGVDGLTDHYSQWKYRDIGADVPLTDKAEMRLIEAEVHWRQGDLQGAQDVLNTLRAAAGLSALPPSSDDDQVFEYLLHERFAELYMEGHRMNDLHRFDLVPAFIAEGRFGSGSQANRPTKFPLSVDEALNNPNIEDDGAVRCLPRAG